MIRTKVNTTLGPKALTFLLLLVAGALATLVLAAPAWSSESTTATATTKIASRVTLAQSSPFHGKVLSKKAACERNRTVKVYRVDPGPDGLYGTTTSNADGEWSIPAGIPHGTFYAVVKQRPIGNGTTVCKRAISPKVTWE